MFFFWTKKAYSTRDNFVAQDQGASKQTVDEEIVDEYEQADKEKGAIMGMSCKDTPADNARMNYHI
ncbi:hypothetical protein [Kurthia populi]|uniref:hypothetical protein n=1 Tax=Kurthia populi TaxID=1562132 RepID=UPI0036D4265D